MQLVTGELFPSTRVLKDEEGTPVPGETQMENVEHLGQYVYEMTNAKVQLLRSERGLPEEDAVPFNKDGVDTGIDDDEFEPIEADIIDEDKYEDVDIYDH